MVIANGGSSIYCYHQETTNIDITGQSGIFVGCTWVNCQSSDAVASIFTEDNDDAINTYYKVSEWKSVQTPQFAGYS